MTGSLTRSFYWSWSSIKIFYLILVAHKVKYARDIKIVLFVCYDQNINIKW